MNWQNYWNILIDKLTAWSEAAVAALPNLVVATLVVAIFAFAAAAMRKLVRKLLEQTTDSKALISLASATVRYTVIGVGLFIALGVLGLQKTVFSLLAGAGIAGLAIGFAFQDLAANFISGIFLAVQRPFTVGDVVEAEDFMGTIREIHLRNSKIETFDGQIVVIPNRLLFENPVTNYSRLGKRRIELAVGVGYGSDLKKVTSTAKKAIESIEGLLEDDGVHVRAQEFGGSSIDFKIHYWIPYPDDEIHYLDAIHDGVLAIKRAFDEEGIEIPFPIRTLDFSRKAAASVRLETDEALSKAS